MKMITDQPVGDVFLDDRGMVYALPLAEPEVIIRYDGNQLVRLGSIENQAVDLHLPAGFEHDILLKLTENRLLSVSNATKQIALIELDDLSMRLRSFEQIGLKDRLLSLGLADDPNRWLSVAEGPAGLTVFEWDTNRVFRSFSFTTGGKVRDAKQVAIGDTILVGVYPTGSYYYDWSGKRIKKLGDEDFVGWEKWETARSYKYLSELKWMPDGRLYASLHWSYPSYYVFNRRKAKFYPAPHPFPSTRGEYVPIPTVDVKGNTLFAGGGRYGQRQFYLKTVNEESYDLKEKLRDAVLGNRDHTNPHSVASEDMSKGLWVAAESGGLMRFNFVDKRINHWGRIFGTLRPLFYREDKLLFNTIQNGIMMYSFEDDISPLNQHLFYDHRRIVVKGAKVLAWDEDGWLWGNDHNTLMGYDFETKAHRDVDLPGDIGRVWGMTSRKRAIVGMADGGMLLIDLESRAIAELQVPAIPHGSALLSVYHDTGGLTWLGTEAGLFYGNPDKLDEWQQMKTPEGDSLRVHHVYPEDTKVWWLASDQGWVSFDPVAIRINKILTTKDGLTDDRVRSTIKVKGMYWIGTRNGMSRYNPTTGKFKTFSHEEGFSSRKFTPGSTYVPDANTLVFGTDNGLNYFAPEDLMDDRTPAISISSLTYFDEQQEKIVTRVGDPHNITGISLPAANRSLEIEFFLSDISVTNGHAFAYRLVGRDTAWTNIKNSNRLSAKALPTGSYTLEIKGKTRFSDWSLPHRITIDVADFFYNTWWFRGGLTLLLFSIAGAWIFRLRREKVVLEENVMARTAIIRLDKETIEKQAEELKDLDAAKTRFFANISHELRTPLTVIKGFAAESNKRRGEMTAAEWGNNMEVINANSDRLLLLVNQLLELGKLEAGKLTPNYHRVDLRPELDLILASFDALAQDKGIHLRHGIAFNNLMADLDTDKFLKIIYNLLSNAVKFTLAGGQVFINATVTRSELLEIRVEDTGIGIDENKLESIFQRFSQIDDGLSRRAEGSGIGLNFSRELARLMGGSLTVKSQRGAGSTFTLLLPRWQKVDAQELITPKVTEVLPLPVIHMATLQTEVDKLPTESEVPLLLLIEDNPDIIAYLRLCLGDKYRTLAAANGKEGVEMAKRQIPDLILSDIMMPVMDGLELCRVLKKDQRTSHIPIILLTALSSVDNRVEGLRQGADAYVSKPFSREELLARIENLLEGRRRLRKYFSTIETPDISELEGEKEIDYHQVESEFLGKLIGLIEARIDDSSLRTEDMAQFVQLSQVQLWRKVKSVTGLSTNDFLRRYRLRRAAEILLSSNFSVSEVAYRVGFSDPSYFSKRFSKEFGKSPSEYSK